ncbi:unnamed protein product [Brassicogethes aeneus]|uniref:non-specific serine/threonine protein kinase n=1 Tax=Brassicogethes aeneus TaxID=1431903 RepID=A0A9P0FAH3_BRAAE|nr:unnamed protein product [Brassicogethes aeneus]
MSNIEDYDIIGILGDNITSASYKVKNKSTGGLFVWQSINYESLSDSERTKLIKKIQKRINLKHPNILKFFDYIDQKENKILYLVVEYCYSGSLKKLIKYCQENRIVLQEEFVCRILYQIVLTIKTLEEYCGNISVDEVFFDEDYNVKLYNYNFNGHKIKLKDLKMSVLGTLIFEMCSLKSYDKNTFEHDCKDLCNVYSGSFITLLTQMVKDSSDVKKSLDKILCHPTLLLKSSKWNKEICFLRMNGERINKTKNLQDVGDKNTKDSHRSRELALQMRERKLYDREQKLLNREKKLVIMERQLNDKLMQAELYLKRCKETKPEQSLTKLTYENLDSTYVECGDSVIMPTSKKLDVNTILKPNTFSRTFSEKRIRFKGHSPLKDLDTNKRKSIRLPRKKEKLTSECSSDWKTCSENDSEIASLDGIKQSKQLFVDDVCENEYEIPPDCRPISWTHENKKYAFELLKIMNEGTEYENQANWNREVRHTQL